jgi:hypothetical protein
MTDAVSRWTVPTSEVPEGGAIKVEKEGLILAVFNLGGDSS